MRKPHSIAARFATARVTLILLTTLIIEAAPMAQALAAGVSNPAIVLIRGTGGGNSGGMAGGTTSGNGGGMGGTSGGGMGGTSGRGMGGTSGGRNSGGTFGGSTADFGQSPSDPGAGGGQYFTYQCVTPAGRCSFVAPAALRGNSLRSGADCACGNGGTPGRVE